MILSRVFRLPTDAGWNRHQSTVTHVIIPERLTCAKKKMAFFHLWTVERWLLPSISNLKGLTNGYQYHLFQSRCCHDGPKKGLGMTFSGTLSSWRTRSVRACPFLARLAMVTYTCTVGEKDGQRVFDLTFFISWGPRYVVNGVSRCGIEWFYAGSEIQCRLRAVNG